jgi:hypothetical protein
MLEDHAVGQETGTTESWPDVLDEYGVQFLLLDRHNDDGLLELFQSQPEWMVDFEDEEAVLFVRARTHNEVSARFAYSGGSC